MKNRFENVMRVSRASELSWILPISLTTNYYLLYTNYSMAAKKEIKRLVRPKKGRKLAGVCVGIADYLNIDPTVVRVFWILLLIPGGLPGLLPYLLFWVVMPEE